MSWKVSQPRLFLWWTDGVMIHEANGVDEILTSPTATALCMSLGGLFQTHWWTNFKTPVRELSCPMFDKCYWNPTSLGLLLPEQKEWNFMVGEMIFTILKNLKSWWNANNRIGFHFQECWWKRTRERVYKGATTIHYKWLRLCRVHTSSDERW